MTKEELLSDPRLAKCLLTDEELFILFSLPEVMHIIHGVQVLGYGIRSPDPGFKNYTVHMTVADQVTGRTVYIRVPAYLEMVERNKNYLLLKLLNGLAGKGS